MSTDELITASLASACGPRPSVFGHGRSDTVAEIADLPKLDARAFFAETHVTEGMAVLLRQVFERLMGRSDQGVFRLKQAMGGGKTHNLLAAALLARDASGAKERSSADWHHHRRPAHPRCRIQRARDGHL